MPARSVDADSQSTVFKDRIDARLVARLADALTRVDPQPSVEQFRRTATTGLGDLELKARVAHVAVALEQCLPHDFAVAAGVVSRLVDAVDAGEVELEGWELWPVTDWVALAGRDAPGVALELLARLTRYATGEFAVRPFIDDDPPGVLVLFDRWIDERDEHVRRLVSEGTRPRLPWAPRLAVAAEDPGYAVGLLDRLVVDDSEYVRRSVSNHLNDLCRVEPALGLSVARRWSDEHGEGPDVERVAWVVKRGLRSLVKQGNPDALRLLGHDPDVAVDAHDFRIATPVVRLGEQVEWSLALESADDRPHRVVVDYAVHFVRANGSSGPKVFKWTTIDLAPGQRVELTRAHRIKPVTIRTFRSGTHVVDVQVNGRVVASGSFELVVPEEA